MGDTGKILVADDDRVVRRIVVATLAAAGYEVSEAANGRETLDRLRAGEAPDLLLVDYMMPGLSGVEVVRALRADPSPALAELPAIMLTSRQEDADVVAGLDAGLDDYIGKPFSPDELAARVRAVLARARRVVAR